MGDTNSKTEEMLESKLLSLNLKKSSYIILGDTKERKRLKEEAVKKPLVLSEQKMTESEEIKYLGEIITNSLEESIHKTVMKHIGIAKQAVYEIRAVIEDKRSRTIGGMNLAFEIFNAPVVSMLIHNSETWCSIPKKTHKV